MGFLESTQQSGIGNNDKPTTESISGVSANMMNIHNYSEITIIYATGTTITTVAKNPHLTLKNKGCVYNGQPSWSFEDGVYDGDYTTTSHSHHHTHHKHHSDRFGSAECQGQSHILRYGGSGSTGSWEFVSHGFITSVTTSTSLNPFSIQGSGQTTPTIATAWAGASGAWIPMTGSTDNYPYGRLRIWNKTYNYGGLYAIQTDGATTPLA
jgi:hypothetical protein